MQRESPTTRTFRRNTAILLSLAAVYAVVTDWIIEPWSACVAFAIVFAATGGLAIRGLWPDFDVRGNWLLIPLATVVLWGIAQLAAGVPEYRFAAWWSTLTWAAAFAFFWSALQVYSPARVAGAMRVAVVIFGALVGLESVLQLFSGDPHIYGLITLDDDTLPMGPFRNRDHYCALMELILPLALWSGIRNRRRSWIYFTAAGVMYSSVIASQSRAGAVIATLEVVLLLVVGIVRNRTGPDAQTARMTAAIAILVAIGGGVVGFGPVLDRFLMKDPFEGRRELFQATLQMIRDRPWFGHGLGSWPWVYPRYAFWDPRAFANHAHNDWAEWASDGGVLFAALLAFIALRAFWLSLGMPWGIGTVAVFAHAAVDFPFARPPLLLAVLLVLALMEVEQYRRKFGRYPDAIAPT